MGVPSQRQHEHFGECMGRAPSTERLFMVWTVDDAIALGNALNVFAHTLLFALFTNRQLVVGSGTVPELLCGPYGVLECAIPYWEGNHTPLSGTLLTPGKWREARAHTPGATEDWRQSSVAPGWREKSPAAVMKSSSKGWNSYAGIDTDRRTNKAVRCAAEALECANASNIDGCFMSSAMDALFSSPTPRASFVTAALTSSRWSGDTATPALVLRGDERFAGTLHLRLLPPFLERKKHAPQPSAAAQRTYDAVVGWLRSDGASEWFTCLRSEVSGGTIFVATDADRLCTALTARHDGLVCQDVKPFHFSFDHAPKQYARFEGRELHKHQHVALDWWLLTRSVHVMGAHRPMNTAKLQPFRAHGALSPGKSFFGWARALSGVGFERDGADSAWDACAKSIPPAAELTARQNT